MPTSIPKEYEALAKSLANELAWEAARALEEVSSGRPAASTTGVSPVFHKIFSSAFRRDLRRAAPIAERARRSLSPLERPTPSVESVRRLAAKISDILVSSATLSATKIKPLKVGAGELPHARLACLPTHSSTLSIVNHSLKCVEDTGEVGEDEISLAIGVVDPVGAVHQFGPWDCGDFSSGTIRYDQWLLASLDLGAHERVRWPRTYTAIFTLAEKDWGGFGDFVAELLDKIRGYVTDKVTAIVSAAVMAYVGAEAAAAIGAMVGLEAGSILPGIGTVIGAIVGAILGWIIGTVFDAIKGWVEDEIFPPLTTEITLFRPGELWNGKTTSDPWGVWWKGYGGYYEFNWTWRLNWDVSLGQSRPGQVQLNNETVQQLAYLAEDRSINALWAGEAWVWTGASAQAQAPQAISDPFAYIANEGRTQHIVYTGTDLQVHELFAGQGETWGHNSPNVAAKTMPAVGRPWGYVFGQAHHIAYRGLDGHIHVMWVQDDAWVGKSASLEAGSPLAAGDPCALVSHGGIFENLFYRGVDGHIHQLWAGDVWSHTCATGWAQTPLSAGDPHAYLPVGDPYQHICYRGTDGHIWVCWWNDQAWVGRSPTIEAGAPLAAGDPYAVVAPDKTYQNVVYRGVDSHIYQLWAGETWQVSTPSLSVGSPTAIGNPTAYFYSELLHIAYLGADGCFHVLWWDGSGWQWKNISAESQAPSAAA